MCIRHPHLTSLIETDEKGTRYFKSGGTVALEFYPAGAIDWFAWYRKEDAEPLDFENGPLVKFLIITGEGQTDVVMFAAHVLGDGTAWLNVTRDLFAALDGTLSNRVLEMPPSIKLKGSLFLPVRLFLAYHTRRFNKFWRQHSRIFTAQERKDFHKRYYERHPTELRFIKFDGDMLGALRKACKAAGVTINTAVAVTFFRALQTSPDERVRIGVSADFRRDLRQPLAEHMGNYVTGVMIEDTAAENIPLKLNRALTKRSKRYEVVAFIERLDGTLIEAGMFSAYGGFNNKVSQSLANVMKSSSDCPSFGISNLGKQSFPGLSFEVEELWNVVPLSTLYDVNVGLVTLDNTMRICLRYSKAAFSEDEANALVDRVVTQLKDFKL
ncbi:MAG: hypothetical protein LBC23_05700 [Coriobacteriales bacterium]|nr:hypothetical protein [Coriobacteriales bacterium]